MKICPACDGDGELVTSHRYTCYHCKGTGYISEEDFDRVLQEQIEISKEISKNVRAMENRQMP